MKSKIILVLVISVIFNQSIYPIKLVYKFKNDQILKIKKEVNSKYYINGEYLYEIKVNEITGLKFESISDDNTMISAKTDYYEIQNVFGSMKEKFKYSYNYSYYKDVLGKTKGTDNFPGIHDFPVFPNKEIEIGDTWESDEIFNMRLFNSPNIIMLDIKIKYKLIGYEENMNGKKNALISADLIFLNEKNKEYLNSIQIFKINGFGNYLIKYDIQEGNITSIDETFDYLFILHDYRIIEIVGNSYLSL